MYLFILFVHKITKNDISVKTLHFTLFSIRTSIHIYTYSSNKQKSIKNGTNFSKHA